MTQANQGAWIGSAEALRLRRMTWSTASATTITPITTRAWWSFIRPRAKKPTMTPAAAHGTSFQMCAHDACRL